VKVRNNLAKLGVDFRTKFKFTLKKQDVRKCLDFLMSG